MPAVRSSLYEVGVGQGMKLAASRSRAAAKDRLAMSVTNPRPRSFDESIPPAAMTPYTVITPVEPR